LAGLASGGRTSGQAGVVVTWALLAGILLAAALPHIDDLGMYYDEAFLAQQARDFVDPARSASHPGSVRSVQILGRPFPVRNAAYLGSLKSQLLIPALAFGGPSPAVVRSFTLAVGLLGLLLSMLFAERILGAPTAVVGGVLVASDPSYFFLSQFEWGPFTTNLLCRMGGLLLATIAWQSPNRKTALPAAACGGALLGLGVFSRADFVVILAAVALGLLLCHRDLVLQGLRERRALVSTFAVAMVIAALPMILSVVDLLQSSSAVSDRGGFAFKLGVLWHVLDGSQFHRLMQVGGVFERASSSQAPTSLFGWLLVPAALGTAAGLFERRRSRPEGADANGQAFLLVTSLVLVATMLVMPGAVRAHHQLNSLPFLQLVVASALVGVWSRRWSGTGRRNAARIGVAIAMASVLIGNIRVIIETQQLIAETGGRGRWSRELHRVAEQIEAQPSGEVVSLDWGFHEPLLFLTTQAKLVEAIWSIPASLQQHRPWVHEGDADTVYLAHDASYDLFGLGPDFLAKARALGKESVRIDAYRDGTDEVAFHAVRILRPHRLVFTGEFRIY
jgi:hypothetical protein